MISMTKYLNFSEDFTEKILKGEKKATLRLGVKDYREGERVIVRCGDREIGTAIITHVHLKKFKEIGEEDAKLDGFESVESLRKALMKFYGDFEDEQIFTQIIFELSEVR